MENIPIQKTVPKPIKFSKEEEEKINLEIARFLEHEIIQKVNENSESEYISNIFFRPKKEGKIRIKLDLKNLTFIIIEQKLPGKKFISIRKHFNRP